MLMPPGVGVGVGRVPVLPLFALGLQARLRFAGWSVAFAAVENAHARERPLLLLQQNRRNW
jgi:hypothetical protein